MYRGHVRRSYATDMRILTSPDHVDTADIDGRYAIYGVCKCTEATLSDSMLLICAYCSYTCM